MEMKEKKISKDMLKNLGVYELREIARTLGVISPTTKKRDILCKEILEISSGKVKVETKQSNKGRPPKSVTKISNLVKEFIPEEVLNLQKPVSNSYSNILKLAQDPSVFLGSNFENRKQIYGYLNSVNGNFYLINLKNVDIFKSLVFYLPNDLIKKYNLRDGDKIFAIGKMAETVNCGLIDKIISINDINLENWNASERKNFDVSCCEVPIKKTTVFGKEIKIGERTISFYKTDEDAIFSILNEIENLVVLNNEKLVFLGVEIAPEIIYYGKSKQNLEMFATSYYNSLEESHNAIINALNFCNSMLKDGFNVRFFIFDAFGLLTRLDQYFASEASTYLGHKISSVQMVKKAVGSGKVLSCGGAITSHSICFENEKENEFVKTELGKIAKII